MGELRCINLGAIALCPNDRPRRLGADTWAAAVSIPPEEVTPPFDVADIAETLAIDGECAYFLEAPAVRPQGSGFVLVFGERRMWAALVRGAETVEVQVLDVSAEEAAVLHYRENACRQDLPPLADAAELARLRDTLGGSSWILPAELAAKTGRTEQHVRRRLLLLDAAEPVREAVAAGGCTLDAAEYFARRPEAEQLRAWSRAVDHARVDEGPVRLDGFVRALFQRLPLARAPWPLGEGLGNDETGNFRACEGCPRRSSTQGTLPGIDAGSEDECLDAKCYGAKAERWADIVVERAKARGIPVLEGAEARAARPMSPGDSTGYVDLDSESPVRDATSKPLTWRMVLPASVTGEPDAVADLGDQTRELVKVDRAVLNAKKVLETAPSAICGESLGSERLQTLDGWAKAQAASRPEVRPAPPPPAETPKPGQVGKANDRAKAEAAEELDRAFTVCAAVSSKAAEMGLETPVLASWVARIVSGDALALVAERWGLNCAPRSGILTEIARLDSGGEIERIDGLAAELLAAELLQHEDRADRDLPGQWAGNGAKKEAAKKPTKKGGKLVCDACGMPDVAHTRAMRETCAKPKEPAGPWHRVQFSPKGLAHTVSVMGGERAVCGADLEGSGPAPAEAKDCKSCARMRDALHGGARLPADEAATPPSEGELVLDAGPVASAPKKPAKLKLPKGVRLDSLERDLLRACTVSPRTAVQLRVAAKGTTEGQRKGALDRLVGFGLLAAKGDAFDAVQR